MTPVTGKPPIPIPLYKKILLLPVTLIVGLPVMIIVGILGTILCGYVYASFAVKAFLLKAKMGKKQRALTNEILTKKLSSESECGTFILESYTLGWNVGRLWWTPDSIPVAESAQIAAEKVDKLYEEASIPHQQWLYDTYVDLEKGKALLLMAWVRKNTQQKFQRLYPTVPHISLWSGAIIANRYHESRKQRQK
jgi:hypothetical protein